MRGRGGDELKHKDEMELAKKARDSDKDKYGGYNKNRGKQPSYKRRRLRGGATMPGRQSNADMERLASYGDCSADEQGTKRGFDESSVGFWGCSSSVRIFQR